MFNKTFLCPNCGEELKFGVVAVTPPEAIEKEPVKVQDVVPPTEEVQSA